MKNRIMTGLLLGGLLSANVMADPYIGVDYGTVSNTDKFSASNGLSSEQNNAYKELKIKLGAGEDGGWKGQVSFSLISYDQTVIDNKNKDLAELGLDAIKEFEVSKTLYPFIKFGIGYGSMKLDNTQFSADSINEVSFNIGAGLSYKLIDNISVMAGVDYVGRKWQDVQYGTITVESTGSGTKIYGGVNLSF